MTYNKAIIPVADDAWRQQQRDGKDSRDFQRTWHYDQSFATVLGIWALVHFSTFGYSSGLLTIVKFLGLIRYLLWPAILMGVGLILLRHKGHLLLISIAPIIPFFVIGIISALSSDDIFTATSPLWLWGFGVLAAAVFGVGCSPSRFRGTVTLFFLAIIVLSFIFIVVRPDLGITADNREEHGAWVGLFPGKNLFGLICVYGLVFAVKSNELSGFIKIAAVAGCSFVLLFSHSQGAVATAGGVLLAHILLRYLQGRNLSQSMQLLTFAACLAAGLLFLLISFAAISELLGRDTTLTGRTEIWADWFRLALHHWLLGTGPGSFTAPSNITAEVSAAEAHLGAIHTPHNMMIAVFGETGLIGLLAFLVPLLYFAVVLPISRPSKESSFTSLVTLTMLVGGITETREVFGVSLNMFLVVASYANLIWAEWFHQKSEDAHISQKGALVLGLMGG